MNGADQQDPPNNRTSTYFLGTKITPTSLWGNIPDPLSPLHMRAPSQLSAKVTICLYKEEVNVTINCVKPAHLQQSLRIFRVRFMASTLEGERCSGSRLLSAQDRSCLAIGRLLPRDRPTGRAVIVVQVHKLPDLKLSQQSPLACWSGNTCIRSLSK